MSDLLPGIIIRQSDLSSYARCAQQKKLSDLSRRGELPPERLLSATVFGTVIHHALNVLETYFHQGRDDALDVALATFAHYWEPENIGQVADGQVDEWMRGHTYGGLRRKGLQVIKDRYEFLQTDTGKLLALEIGFNIPYVLDGRQHTIHGTADRLSVRRGPKGKFLNIEDFKSGRRKTFLRYDVQFTVYSWATTQREFWSPWENGDELWELHSQMGRRGTWIDVVKGKRVDAGWRGEQDYARMDVALREYVKAVEFDVYPLAMQGDVCVWCPHRDNCGGVAVPDEDYGRP